jgi:hypothetical protein
MAYDSSVEFASASLEAEFKEPQAPSTMPRPAWVTACLGRIPMPGTQPIPEGSAEVRRRVVAAREIQLERAGLPNA